MEKQTVRDSTAQTARALLEPYQKRFKAAAERELDRAREEPDVRKACSYAVLSEGKRLRPAIVWMVAEALGADETVSLAALAVEFFHVSSLIIDDLPCMDDDDFRRGVPSTHKAFSEQAAILASFALTAWGFDAITRVSVVKGDPHEVLREAVSAASACVGLPGLIGGQWLDLCQERVTRESYSTIVDRKTGVLFELCFVLGWLFGGGESERLSVVRKMARSFGRAFQLVDDLDDVLQDRAAGKEANYAILFGEEETRRQVIDLVAEFCSLAASLGLEKTPLLPLAQALSRAVEKRES